MPKKWLVLIMALAVSLSGRPVEIVMIDQAAEAELGKFPFDRGRIADAVTALQRAGARAVVLKFFFDQPRSATGDRRLADAMRGPAPVILQARLDDAEPKSNGLPDRFYLSDFKVAPSAAIAGSKGWLPLPMLAERAAAVGFIDRLNPAPIIEVHQGKVVPSLYLVSVELMLGQKVNITPNQHIRVGERQLPLDGKNCVKLPWPRKDAIDYVPFMEIVRGAPSVARLKDKVVIIGYDGSGMHSFDTPAGKIKAHRLFYYQLCILYDQLKAPVTGTRQ
jgi:CHASE2 domain-containing sensor protein